MSLVDLVAVGEIGSDFKGTGGYKGVADRERSAGGEES